MMVIANRIENMVRVAPFRGRNMHVTVIIRPPANHNLLARW